MNLEVETILAVSIMMAVFSAVAAVGTSLVLGAGFERLRTGFDVVKRQTGFFSEAIHKLEQKVETVDKQTNEFENSINELNLKVHNVGEQANLFTESVDKLEKKVEVVDRQTGFFSNAIRNLEQKVDTINEHEKIVSEKMEHHANTDMVSTSKAEALVSHAESLLPQVGRMASELKESRAQQLLAQQDHMGIKLPENVRIGDGLINERAKYSSIEYH